MTASFNTSGKPTRNVFWDTEDRLNRWRVDVASKMETSLEVEPSSSTVLSRSESVSGSGDQQPQLTQDPFIDALNSVIQSMSINSTDHENSSEPPTSAYVEDQLDQLDSGNPLTLSTCVVAGPPILSTTTKSTLGTGATQFTTKHVPVPYRRLEERSAEPRHDDYFTYTKCQTHIAYGTVTFFIQGQTRNGVIWPDPGLFEVTAISLLGRPCTVSVELDPSKSRYICSFMAAESGIYEGVVQLLYPEPRHINGSPFRVAVSRDYNLSKHRFTMHPMRPKMKTISKESLPPVKCWGIDVDLSSEKIYMTNRETNSVRILSPRGSKLLEFGNPDNEQMQKLCRPTGVAVDAINRKIVISDKDNHRICFWSLEGEFLHSFGKKGDKDGDFSSPWGVAVSPNGIFIAVADSKNRRIQLFDKSGNFLRKFSDRKTKSVERKNDLKCPRGICFDKTGQNIYVTDFKRHAVYVLDLDLTQKRTFVPPSTILGCQGLAVDLAGNVLICDSRNNCVQVVSPDGTFLSKISGDSKFVPRDLTILREGQVAVLDVTGKIRIY